MLKTKYVSMDVEFTKMILKLDLNFELSNWKEYIILCIRKLSVRIIFIFLFRDLSILVVIWSNQSRNIYHGDVDDTRVRESLITQSRW